MDKFHSDIMFRSLQWYLVLIITGSGKTWKCCWLVSQSSRIWLLAVWYWCQHSVHTAAILRSLSSNSCWSPQNCCCWESRNWRFQNIPTGDSTLQRRFFFLAINEDDNISGLWIPTRSTPLHASEAPVMHDVRGLHRFVNKASVCTTNKSHADSSLVCVTNDKRSSGVIIFGRFASLPSLATQFLQPLRCSLLGLHRILKQLFLTIV